MPSLPDTLRLLLLLGPGMALIGCASMDRNLPHLPPPAPITLSPPPAAPVKYVAAEAPGLPVTPIKAPVTDSDYDGVPDSADKCPLTPAGSAVDDKGCPPDADKDGVPDSADKCPGTPAGAKVDAKGCSAPAPIGTGGGNGNWKGNGSGYGNGEPVKFINNNNVYAAPAPEKPTEKPAEKAPVKPEPTPPAMTVADADKDGVPDAADQCPGTAAGVKVDAKGCALPLEQDLSITLKVLFATDKATIISKAMEDIRKVADFMRTYPDATVFIEGHTDDRASEMHNVLLSYRRAEAVRRELIRAGANPAHLKAVGYGEAMPIAGNDSEEGRQQNRRVVATVKADTRRPVAPAAAPKP